MNNFNDLFFKDEVLNFCLLGMYMEWKMNDFNYYEGENGSIGGNVLYKYDKFIGY